MQDYSVANLHRESIVLAIASTFGEGDAPANGQTFKKDILEILRSKRDHTAYNALRYVIQCTAFPI